MPRGGGNAHGSRTAWMPRASLTRTPPRTNRPCREDESCLLNRCRVIKHTRRGYREVSSQAICSVSSYGKQCIPCSKCYFSLYPTITTVRGLSLFKSVHYSQTPIPWNISSTNLQST